MTYFCREDAVLCGTKKSVRILEKLQAAPLLALPSGTRLAPGQTLAEGRLLCEGGADDPSLIHTCNILLFQLTKSPQSNNHAVSMGAANAIVLRTFLIQTIISKEKRTLTPRLGKASGAYSCLLFGMAQNRAILPHELCEDALPAARSCGGQRSRGQALAHKAILYHSFHAIR